MKEIILIGTGKVAKDALVNLGIENIAYVYDNYLRENEETWESIPFLNFNDLLKKAQNYRIIITPKEMDPRFELCKQFQDLHLDYELYQINHDIPSGFVHIFGKYPELHYKFNLTGIYEWTFNRAFRLRKMFQTVFETFSNDFVNQSIDVWCFLGDMPMVAYKQAIGIGIKHVYCYATTDALSDVVIPMPDYNSFISEDDVGGGWYPSHLTFKDYKSLAGTHYTDERAFWIGNLSSNKLRTELYWLGKKYPEYLDIYEKVDIPYQRCDGGNQYIPPEDFTKYKYLVDIPGCSWADRTKLLLQLGRPVLLIDRIEKEWFWDKLIPMKHYVPIRSDFSDLIQKITFLNEHPDLYKEIVRNARLFSDEYFSPVKTLNYMKSMILNENYT